jgi:hypothetical protein
MKQSGLDWRRCRFQLLWQHTPSTPKPLAGLPLLALDNISEVISAALAMERGAALAFTDGDFSRFPGLSWINPLSSE